jgi:hypothetical protein
MVILNSILIYRRCVDVHDLLEATKQVCKKLQYKMHHNHPTLFLASLFNLQLISGDLVGKGSVTHQEELILL